MTLVQDLDYAGRRVLITGAANGFGAAMSVAFKAAGATVIMADIEGGTPACGGGATRRRVPCLRPGAAGIDRPTVPGRRASRRPW